VEQAFRICKTVHRKTCAIHLCKAEHTPGHVLVVMLAYRLRRVLSRARAALDATAQERLAQLETLCSTEIQIEGGGGCLRILQPSGGASALLEARMSPCRKPHPTAKPVESSRKTAHVPSTPLTFSIKNRRPNPSRASGVDVR
jgi:CRP-like cAMP-binding protein